MFVDVNAGVHVRVRRVRRVFVCVRVRVRVRVRAVDRWMDGWMDG